LVSQRSQRAGRVMLSAPVTVRLSSTCRMILLFWPLSTVKGFVTSSTRIARRIFPPFRLGASTVAAWASGVIRSAKARAALADTPSRVAVLRNSRRLAFPSLKSCLSFGRYGCGVLSFIVLALADRHLLLIVFSDTRASA